LLKLRCLFVIIKPQKSACEETQGAHVAKGFKRTQLNASLFLWERFRCRTPCGRELWGRGYMRFHFVALCLHQCACEQVCVWPFWQI